MEQTATGSGRVPLHFPSKLQELLTADRSTRRSDLLADTSSVASVSGDSIGDDGTNSSSDTLSDKYRNPRKRLLLSSMNASEAEESTDDQSEKEKKIMKKSSTGEGTVEANTGPDSFKVAPIILKKYYPSAVQSAECEEFLVSLSDEDSQIQEEGPIDAACTTESDSSVNGNAKPVVTNAADLEYMGAQIDKLLGMSNSSSSSSGTKKASRRQRRFQCEVCPKSYSTEDDLKSHVLSHSEGENAKPFQCEHCDKKFKWVASLRGHMRKVHNEMRSPGTEDEMDSSEEEDSSSPPSQEEKSSVESTPEGKIKADTAKKPVSSKSAPQEPQPQTFESVVSKILSRGGLVSHNHHAGNSEEKSLPPRRKCSSTKEKEEKPPRRSTTRKDSKSNNNVKEQNDTKKKTAVANETEGTPSPQTVSLGRTSLRRNIQRPKWLTDSDLVTDYEFPSGTKAMRAASNVSSPSSSAAAINGNQTKTRTVSTESTEESTTTGKNQKSDRGKSNAVPASERKIVKIKEEAGAPKQGKVEPKKESGKKAIKKEPKKEKVTKAMRSESKNKIDCKSPIASESPTHKLSTKILSLSLNDCGNEETPAKSPREKNARKRPVVETPKSASKGSASKSKKSKRKVSLDLEEKNSEELNSLDKVAAPASETSDEVHMPQNDMLTKTTTADVETSSNSLSVQSVQSNNLLGQDIVNPLMDATDAKKLEEQKPIIVNVQSEQQNHEIFSSESTPAQLNENFNGLDPITDAANSVESNNTTNSVSPLLLFTLGSSSIEIETQKVEIETAIPITTPFPLFNCEEVVASGDITEGIDDSSNWGKATVIEVESNLGAESTIVEPEVLDRLKEVVELPISTNDEEMPVLKPEASSSAAGSRSDSLAERMQSIDEDVSSSSNSNHSIVPQQAPVLSKEATMSNGIVKIPLDCNTVFSDSTVADQDQLEELPMIDTIDGEEECIRMRRDRSDSLSMRSCGSGSQSEKIKALEVQEDIAPNKGKRPLPDDAPECLVDYDSNDSLMSEFSELAAQLSEKTDGVKFKEECIRFLTTKVSANSMWAIRKELKRLKKDKNYFKFGKLCPLAAGLMHDIFCQALD